MNKLLIAAILFLLLGGPLFAAGTGLHPALPAFAGLCCALILVMRFALALPQPGGAASPSAAADARLLADQAIDLRPHRGLGITDVGGAR